MSQVQEDHNAQTEAKSKEQERLSQPPEKGQGKECFKCGMSVWHSDLEQHIDDHLDDYLKTKLVLSA